MGDSSPAPGRSLPLLEREHELALLEQLLTAGEGAGPVVVEGPAGIGKTRLLAELRERAVGQGRTVVSAQGSDLEREFPFGVVRQLFEPVLAWPEMRARLFEGAAATAGSVFEPVAHATGAEGDASFPVLHGLYWLTINLASERSLVIVVDDLHWCDRPSLRFLAYLVRRLEGLGALLVLGLRSADPGTDPVMLGEIVTGPDVLHIHPGPLSEAAVAGMVRSRFSTEPDPAFVTACRAATGGNPLLLRQLLTSLESDAAGGQALGARAVEEVGPRAVSRTVLLRLRRLEAAATTVAQAVAVLGNDADLPRVAAMTGLDEAGVAGATATLARSEILRPDPPLGFVHPLVRDAVYHSLPPGERELLQAAAARLLIDSRAPAEAVATHLLAAPRRGEAWVVELLREAAMSARRKGAADSAVAYLERALREPPPEEERTAVLLELGLDELLVSGPAAAEHLREAFEALRDPVQRAHVAATLARALMFTAPPQEAVDVAARAQAEISPELIDERQALRALELMAVFFGTQDQSPIERLGEIEIIGDGPGAKMLASIVSFVRALGGAPVAEALPLARRALADDILIEADQGLFPVGPIFVHVLSDSEEALTAWDKLHELAHRRGSLMGILTVELWRGATMLWRGDLREAEELLEAAQLDLKAWGPVRAGGIYGLAFLGGVKTLRGDLRRARELLNPSGVTPDEQRSDAYRHLLRSWAELLLVDGDFEQAVEVADDLSGRLAFIQHPGWAPWRSLKARALDGLGRTEAAIALVEDELALARRIGAAGQIGRELRLLGQLKRERGLDHLREAVTLLEHSTLRLELAVALHAFGRALRLARQPAEAREPLRRALDLADRCGADVLVEDARAELHAAGARPRSTALQGVDSLTPSERRVVDLAVEGRSNKDIAQSLYVTPKTVEVHLSNAYRKLGIRSRQQLGQALAA
jgi:DNA-binding CsgD family transcriptional regulator